MQQEHEIILKGGTEFNGQDKNKAANATHKDLEKLIKTFHDIDKTVYDYIKENKLMSKPALEVTLREIFITGESFKNIVIRQGFIKQNTVTDIILKLRPFELMDEEVIEPSIPYELLKTHRIMICAVTDTTVYLSTTKSKEVAELELRQFFPKRDFFFIPANITRMDNYLSKIKKIVNSDANFLEKVLREAIRKGASDIHIEPELNGYSINIRILGVMENIHFGNEEEYNKIMAVLKVQSGLDVAQKRIDQDGSYTIEFNGRNIDLRVVTIPASYGKETGVIRILDPDKVQVNLNALGISNVEDWRKGIQMKNGLCLICGETGSGKTTTLNSSIREMDRFTKKIYTIEDPVEYQINNVSQINIDKATGMTFAKALKACMRGDPDVIVVGEVRDEETARNMVKAAETGHLVIATLHTGQVLGAINRLRDIGVEKNELRDILRAVLVQSLVRVSCPHCQGKGCGFCANVGYIDRTVVSECVYFKDYSETTKLLSDNPEPWWKTKEEDAYDKYKQGKTTKEEFIRVFGETAREILRKNGED